MIDIEALRRSFYQAIDTILDSVVQQQTQGDNKLTIIAECLQPSFIYNFATGPETMHDDGQWFSVTGSHGSIKMLLAKTDRDRRGALRPACIVFAHPKDTNHPETAIDCVEFTQTDNPGEFCCEIPNPDDPRKKLKDGMSIPPRFAHSVVMRTDQIYASVKNGPTLRLVVQESDTNVLIAHGLWVASLRKRI